MEDNLGWYLQQVSRAPLLTPSEEITLGSEVQKYMAIRDKKDLTPEERRIIKRGKRAKDRMFEANLKLVVHLCRKYSEGGSMTLLDMIQEGNIGLSRAIEKFDPKLGYKFSTYSYWWIRQAITRSLMISDRTIRIPLNAFSMHKAVASFSEEFLAKNKRWPTVQECADFSGVRVQTMRAYLDHVRSPLSLDMKVMHGNNFVSDMFLLDVIASEYSSPDQELEIREGLENLDEFISELPRRSQEVIYMRYGLEQERPKTYEEIGRILGVSRERARQIEQEALNKMRRSYIRFVKNQGKDKP